MASARVTAALPMPATVWSVLKFGGMGYVFYSCVGQFIQCQGPSMLPTLNAAGDVVFVDKLSKRWKPIERRELVVARSPTNEHERVCKRVVAVAGDMVSPNRSNAGPRDPTVPAYRVPRGHVWLEGDNLANSTDSRRYGVVPESMIEGRCIFRVWPLTQFSVFWGPVDEIPRPTKEQRREAALEMASVPRDPSRQPKRPRAKQPAPDSPASSIQKEEGQ